MRVAIQQPNYAPWCGYFAKLCHCETFIFLDDVQMPNRGYVSRTRIRQGSEAKWLSLPTRFSEGDLIRDVQLLTETNWVKKHLGTLQHTYGRCPCYKEVLAILQPVYELAGTSLAAFNSALIQAVVAYLQIPVRLELSSDLAPEGTSDRRLINLVQKVGGDTYISGAGGQNYQNPEHFAAAGIQLDVKAYVPIPYPQTHGPFLGGLSIIDALFHLGRRARDLLHYPQS